MKPNPNINLFIDKYVLLMNEFFQMIQNSPMMGSLNYPSYYTYIGVNSIHRVFENIMIKTKNIHTAYYYAKKSYYYYLEYISQLHSSNLLANMNYTDIILFIYTKTIFNMDENNASTNEHDTQSTTMTNIMTLFKNDVVQITDHELNDIFHKILKMVNTLFYWTNAKINFETRHHICNFFLSPFLHLTNLDLTQTNLELIQPQIEMSSQDYEMLLTEILNINTSNKVKKRTWTDIEKQEYILVKFYMNQDTLLEKFETNNMSEFVKWVYT